MSGGGFFGGGFFSGGFHGGGFWGVSSSPPPPPPPPTPDLPPARVLGGGANISAGRYRRHETRTDYQRLTHRGEPEERLAREFAEELAPPPPLPSAAERLRIVAALYASGLLN